MENDSKKSYELLNHIIKARKACPGWDNCRLFKFLEKKGNARLINLIGVALQNANNAERIFSRTSQIKTELDPDGVIDDMLAELRVIPYLLCKGFRNVHYHKENNVDFTAEFNGTVYGIEVAFLRGPNFKTQRLFKNESKNTFSGRVIPAVYELDSGKLISRLKSIYQAKEKQVLKHDFQVSTSIIIIVSYLLELGEELLNHETFQGKHPVDAFVLTRKVPTVVIGPGSIYEPELNVFRVLNKFDWNNPFLEAWKYK